MDRIDMGAGRNAGLIPGSNSKRHGFLVLFLFMLVVAGICGGESFGASAEYSFLKDVTPERYPHDHAVLAREVQRIEFKKDGSSFDRDEVFLTMLDNDGVRENSVQVFYVNRHYMELRVALFEVIAPDGTVRVVDLEKNAREDSSASSSRMNIYDPSQRELRVFVPELHPGDTIHYVVLRNNFKSMIPGEFFGRVTTEYTFPVREYHFELKGPSDMKLYTLVKDAKPGSYSSWTSESESRTITYHFSFSNVPALVPEPAMPPLQRVAMRLLYSTIPTWGDVATWYKGLVEPHLASTPAIREKVRELVGAARNEQEKIAALFYFVAQKIRYMGITAERDRPGYEPHDVSLTFNRRYGVCRDKAALLVTMLREAGFNAVPVIISAGNKLDPEVVVPWFNHAIVAILDTRGRPDIYLDPTSETSRQFLPDYERDSSCLAASGPGAELRLTPEPDASANMSFFVVKARLDSSGVLRGSMQATFTGFCDTALRGRMMGSSAEERRQTVEQIVLARIPGAVLKNLKWTDPEDRATPFGFSCDFQVTNRVSRSQEGQALFFPVSSTDYVGIIDSYLMDRASLNSRKYPLRFNYVVRSRMIEETLLPPGADSGLILPSDMEFSGNAVDASFLVKKRGAGNEQYGAEQKVVFARELTIKALEVPVSEYREILKAQRRIAEWSLVPVIMNGRWLVESAGEDSGYTER